MRRLVAATGIGAVTALVALASSSPAATDCDGVPANIVGGDGPDLLAGTAGPDVVALNGGDDIFLDAGGDDLICGGPGGDIIFGDEGSDEIFGESGSDAVFGGAGPDLLSGGPGFDNVGYSEAPGPVEVSLAGGTGSGADGQDDLSGFEGVFGSEFGDVLIGSSSFNSLDGQGGDDDIYARGGVDVIIGGVGSDFISGGEGTIDMAYYLNSPTAVVADLEAGTATSGPDEDVLVEIEGVSGSAFPDVLLGDDGENVMGGARGDDIINGRGSVDFLLSFGVFPEDPEDEDAEEILFGGPHIVDLAAQTASDRSDPTEVNGDTVISFTFVAGGHRNDVLYGTSGNDSLIGERGNDKLFGRGGNDSLAGGPGADLTAGGPGRGDQVFYYLDGAVNVNLATGKARVGGSTDRVSGVEEVVGSEKRDVIKGNRRRNVLAGTGGRDRIFGGGGRDLLLGRAFRLPLGDLAGAPTAPPPATNLKNAKLLDGGRGRDICQGARRIVRCEKRRLTAAARLEFQSIIDAIQDIKRRRGVRLSG